MTVSVTKKTGAYPEPPRPTILPIDDGGTVKYPICVSFRESSKASDTNFSALSNIAWLLDVMIHGTSASSPSSSVWSGRTSQWKSPPSASSSSWSMRACEGPFPFPFPFVALWGRRGRPLGTLASPCSIRLPGGRFLKKRPPCAIDP